MRYYLNIIFATFLLVAVIILTSATQQYYTILPHYNEQDSIIINLKNENYKINIQLETLKEFIRNDND